MQRTIQTFVPLFNGFYNTYFEDIIDNAEYGFVEFYNEENGTEKTSSDFNFNYDKIKNEIIKSILEIVTKKLNENGIKCASEFETIVSPKYYNFDNDSGNCTFYFEDFNQVIECIETNRETFNPYIKNIYTSRDGFSSFHSNDGEDWISELKDPEEELTHKCGECLEFLLIHVFEFNRDQLISELYEEFFSIDTLPEN